MFPVVIFPAVTESNTVLPLTVKLLSTTTLLLETRTTPLPDASNSKSLSLSVVLNKFPVICIFSKNA